MFVDRLGWEFINILCDEMKKNNKRAPSYLDVAEFMMSGPFSPKIQAGIIPLEVEHLQVTNFQQLDSKSHLACRGGFSLICSYHQESHSFEQANLHLDRRKPIALPQGASREGGECRDRIHGFYLGGTSIYVVMQNESDEQFEEEEEEK